MVAQAVLRSSTVGSRRSTIRDVAREAGVSVSTVSNWLGGRHHLMEPATREAVAVAVERLSYRPSSLARGLRGQSTRVIGLIVPSIVNPSLPTIVRGAEDRAREEGYSLFLSNIDRHWDRALDDAHAMMDRGVEAIGFVFAASGPSDAILDAAARSNARVVFVIPKGDALESQPSITLDNEAAMRQLAEHLWRLGHRRIAFISNHTATANAAHRIAGLNAALARYGSSLHCVYDDPIAFDPRDGWGEIESGRRSAVVLLSSPDPPTAICAGNDMMAVGVLKGAAELGLRVPGELSVAGFDDLTIARVVSPTLTTLAVAGYELGKQLAEVLLGLRPAGGPAVTPTLVVRESTGRPPLDA